MYVGTDKMDSPYLANIPELSFHYHKDLEWSIGIIGDRDI